MEVDAGEVFSIINSFENKSTCDTKMSALKIANTSFDFTITLGMLINTSFREGVFPDQMKLAKVIPVHKGGAKTDVGNYRPRLLLSTLSKIYEKLIYNRILNFLEKITNYMKHNMGLDLCSHVSMPYSKLHSRFAKQSADFFFITDRFF